MHYMNKTCTPESPGSILLVASTSGYFGGTGVAAYIASKHGVVGLLRSSQLEAKKRNIRINCVSPFLTPTAITVNFAQQWIDHGLEANTPENVASVIAQTAIDEELRGASVLVSGLSWSLVLPNMNTDCRKVQKRARTYSSGYDFELDRRRPCWAVFQRHEISGVYRRLSTTKT